MSDVRGGMGSNRTYSTVPFAEPDFSNGRTRPSNIPGDREVPALRQVQSGTITPSASKDGIA